MKLHLNQSGGYDFILGSASVLAPWQQGECKWCVIPQEQWHRQTVPDLAHSLPVKTHSIKRFSRAAIATCVRCFWYWQPSGVFWSWGWAQGDPLQGLERRKRQVMQNVALPSGTAVLCCSAQMNSNGWWQYIRMPK